MPSKRWTSGNSGLFGDSFFSDCWDIVDTTSSRRQRHVVQEDVASDVPEEHVKPWFRKTHLNRVNDDNIYQVMLEVSNFTPSELSVKLANDKTVIVEGKHSERADTDGFVSREFTRKYNLPESVIANSLECYLSKDGVLVIRGHAPRSRPNTPNGKIHSPTERKVVHHDEHVIPIFTKGCHNRHTSESNTHYHKERIIPIAEENGHANQNTTIREETPTPNNSERSSRTNSERDGVGKRTKENVDQLQNGRRSRTVSFTDDDTIASNSPIIEEPPSVSTPAPTPTPESQSSSSKKIPPLVRQNNFQEDSFSERRSTSRMSEEKFERSQTPVSPSPGFGTNGNHIEAFDSHSNEKRDRFHSKHVKNLLDDFDRLHKEVVEKHRHLSRESLDRLNTDTDSFLKIARSRSPLVHRSNDDIFDSDFLKKLDLKWEPNNFSRVSPKSREEQYEKKFEKGYDSKGIWTETLEERMFSSYSTSDNSNKQKKSINHDKYRTALEHPINISSPA